MTLVRALRTRDEPLQIGMIGAGIFGSPVVHTLEQTPGVRTAVIADLAVEKARSTFHRSGTPVGNIRTVWSTGEIAECIASGERAVTADGETVASAELDLVVEATGDTDSAVRHILCALLAQNSVVNVTVEVDAVVGPIFSRIAKSTDVTYSLVAGDQPGKIVELHEWATLLGLEVVAAGEARNAEFTPYGTPDDAIERHGFSGSLGDGIDADPRMFNTFLDGTKAAVESVSAANALGHHIDTLGMHQPRGHALEMPEILVPARHGGLLDSVPAVDTVLVDDRRLSVFVVTRTDDRVLQEFYAERANVVSSQSGRYQLFFTPYHLSPESTVSIARVAVTGQPTAAPIGHHAEVVAAAKRDLSPGDELDGGGGYTVYGLAADASEAQRAGYVPFALLEGARLSRAVERDQVLTYTDVEIDRKRPVYYLRRLQEAVLGREGGDAS